MQASSLRASFSQISPAYVSLGLIAALLSMSVSGYYLEKRDESCNR